MLYDSFFYFLFYTFIRALVTKRKARLSLLDGKKRNSGTILLSAPEEIGIGFLAGVASRSIISPLNVITIRLQTAGENDSNGDDADLYGEPSTEKHKEITFSSTVKQIYNEEGIAGFWKGLWLSSNIYGMKYSITS